MRSTSIETLTAVAREGVDVHLLTADLGFKVLDRFRDAHPARFTNVGVSEANMIGVAAGLAISGMRPVCYSMVPFLFMRAFEQVRVDVVAPQLPVVLLGVGGGLSYGHEGMSHHAIEDVAIARALPGLRVIAPGDPFEADAALRFALTSAGPTFIRLGKNGDPRIHSHPVDIARPITVRNPEGSVVVLATGHILAAAVAACDRLAASGLSIRVVSVPLLKPFDDGFVRALARTASAVFTVEEHSEIGGLGSHVAELLLAERFAGTFAKIALPDRYATEHGSLDWLRAHYRLDANGIAERIRKLVAA
jgi:transketolase